MGKTAQLFLLIALAGVGAYLVFRPRYPAPDASKTGGTQKAGWNDVFNSVLGAVVDIGSKALTASQPQPKTT